jgi:hypothetical protein
VLTMGLEHVCVGLSSRGGNLEVDRDAATLAYQNDDDPKIPGWQQWIFDDIFGGSNYLSGPSGTDQTWGQGPIYINIFHHSAATVVRVLDGRWGWWTVSKAVAVSTAQAR